MVTLCSASSPLTAARAPIPRSNTKTLRPINSATPIPTPPFPQVFDARQPSPFPCMRLTQPHQQERPQLAHCGSHRVVDVQEDAGAGGQGHHGRQERPGEGRKVRDRACGCVYGEAYARVPRSGPRRRPSKAQRLPTLVMLGVRTHTRISPVFSCIGPRGRGGSACRPPPGARRP